MLGAIIGDIVGSRWEFDPTNDYNFEWMTDANGFTDDTICTVAVADALLKGREYGESIHEWCRHYLHPMGGYGGRFAQWVMSDKPQPYNSFGNGSAMRVSSVGWAFDSLEQTEKYAMLSALPTHNHPEGIKGAQATAAAIFMARTGSTKEEIRRYISENFGYDMNRTCDDIRPTYSFDGSCQGTVPESIIAFLDSKDYEDAIRLCISLGGDADTMGAITGAIAGAYYHQMPYDLYEFARNKLPDDIKGIIKLFDSEHARNVSYTWRNPNYNTEELIRKVKSGDIFI